MAEAGQGLFLFAHIRAQGGGWQALAERVTPALQAWPEARLWGVFMGLFGVRNHDVFVMLSFPGKAGSAMKTHELAQALQSHLPPDTDIADVLALQATVRPLEVVPLKRPGVFVFRFFDVQAGDVDEVVQLSDTAWKTFEGSESYQSEPVGLFRFADPELARGRMLLLTWYDNLTSWELSRTPHPDATANFRRRAALSRSVIAYATRLVP